MRPSAGHALPGLALIALVAGASIVVDVAALLSVLPALGLLLSLTFGRFVGERRIARLRRPVAPRVRRRRAPTVALAPRLPRVTLVRGGRLIAASLAVRPPPAAASAAA